MSLGEQLKLLRQEKQLSQPELAAMAGIEQSYLSKLENDKSMPSNEMLRKLLTAFGISLAELLNKLPTASINKLSALPDVELWLAKRNSQQFNQRRNYLLIASMLIVLATTLFYTGFSKVLFTGVSHQYISQGVVLAGEPQNIFNDWPKLIERGQKGSRQLHEKKVVEMTKRKDVQFIHLEQWMGEYIERAVDGGTRYFEYSGQKVVSKPINAWLQILGVLLFSAGVMGFVVERKLFK